MHLISNIVFLLFLGWVAEALFGHAGLLLLWIASGTTGSLAELISRQPNSVSLGASGVVYGLIGALLSVCVFWRGLFSKRLRYLGIVSLIFLATTGIYGDWYLYRRLNPAHVGGLLAGFLFALIVPLATERARSKIVASTVIALVLSATTLIAIRRQKVWVELDAIDPVGLYMVNSSSIPKLEQIVAARPDILRAHVLLAEAYQSGHRYQDAVREYKYILREQPLSEHAWYRMGWAFMDSGRPENAIDAFSHSFQIDSKNAIQQNAHFPQLRTTTDEALAIRMDREALARAYEAAGRVDAAIAEYKEILKANTDDYVANREVERLELLPHTADSTGRTKDPSKLQ